MSERRTRRRLLIELGEPPPEPNGTCNECGKVIYGRALVFGPVRVCDSKRCLTKWRKRRTIPLV